MVVFFDLLLRRVENQSREMAKQHLEYDGLSLLRQVDGGGVLLGQIDLSRPFKVRYAYAAFGNATYEVSQQPSGTTPADIRFTSRINGAQRIVTKLLRYHEWPPGDSM